MQEHVGKQETVAVDSIKQAIDKSKLQSDIRDNRPIRAGRPDSRDRVGEAWVGATKCNLNRAELEQARIVAFDGENTAARSYDMLRTRIMQKSPTPRPLS